MITFTDAWRRATIHSNGTMTILAHKTSSIGWTVAAPAPTRIMHVDAGVLEFQPAGAHQVASLANLGHQLLQEIDAYRPGFLWTASPAEIVGALIEELPAAVAAPKLVADEREAFEREVSKLAVFRVELERYTEDMAARNNDIWPAPYQPVAAGDYVASAVQSGWRMWQARAALAAAQVQEADGGKAGAP